MYIYIYTYIYICDNCNHVEIVFAYFVNAWRSTWWNGETLRSSRSVSGIWGRSCLRIHREGSIGLQGCGIFHGILWHLSSSIHFLMDSLGCPDESSMYLTVLPGMTKIDKTIQNSQASAVPTLRSWHAEGMDSTLLNSISLHFECVQASTFRDNTSASSYPWQIGHFGFAVRNYQRELICQNVLFT